MHVSEITLCTVTVNMLDRNNVGTSEPFLGCPNIFTVQHIYSYGMCQSVACRVENKGGGGERERERVLEGVAQRCCKDAQVPRTQGCPYCKHLLAPLCTPQGSVLNAKRERKKMGTQKKWWCVRDDAKLMLSLCHYRGFGKGSMAEMPLCVSVSSSR